MIKNDLNNAVLLIYSLLNPNLLKSGYIEYNFKKYGFINEL